MKKIFSLLCAIALMTSCNKTDGYTISGKTVNVEDGTKVYVKIQVETGLEIKDSTEVKKGTFKIKGDNVEPIVSYISFGKDDLGIPFFLENGNIEVVYDKDDIENSKVSGTKNNNYLNSFKEKNKDIEEKFKEFQKNNSEQYMNAMMSKNESVIDSLTKIMEGYTKELENNYISFIKENTDSYLSLLILKDLTSSSKINKEDALEIFNKMPKEIQEHKDAKELKEILNDEKVELTIGMKAPDFSAPNLKGETVSLKESLGKVTIIDFWASWCKPCRDENPNMVKLYNKFHDKGLNIIGVSLDKEADKWKEAIEKDKLTWAHVSNLKFWEEPVAKDYEIKFIPSVFILDENGVIVAKDLRGEELEEKVASLLK